MRKARFLAYIVVGMAIAWSVTRVLPHGSSAAELQLSSRGLSSYDLPVPKMLPVAAYDSN
jgi:hypothetical protein